MVIGFQEFNFRYPPCLLIRSKIEYFIDVFEEDITIADSFPKWFGTIFTIPEIQYGRCRCLKTPLNGHIWPGCIRTVKIPGFVSSAHSRVDIYPTALWTVAVTSKQVFLGGGSVPERIIDGGHIVGDNIEVITGTKAYPYDKCYKYFM